MVPVYEEDGFQFRPESMRERLSERTRAVFINSPSNPTGNLLSKERMQAIADMPPWIVSDEIYHGLVYEGKEHSILEFTDRAFVLNGFSKLFAMTGLRLGYLIAPKEFVRPIQKVHQNFFISANAMCQRAGIVALKESAEDVASMKRIYNERRVFMIRRLREMGLGITVEPTGAFYVFANARHLSEDSYALAFEILEKACVGVTPGIDFGKHGEGYLRFSYANLHGEHRRGSGSSGSLSGDPQMIGGMEMIVKSAAFITSAVKPDQYPDALCPEVAFAGRSNVGKSSLINTLVNRKRLVKTSSTPGRTQLINFFSVNENLFLVDLPGYGYAKVPAAVKRKWGPMIETYLKGRDSLAAVVLIMDIRRLPGIEEQNFIDWLNLYRRMPILVLTKADKLSKIKRQKQARAIGAALNAERVRIDSVFRQDPTGQTGCLVGHRAGRIG